MPTFIEVPVTGAGGPYTVTLNPYAIEYFLSPTIYLVSGGTLTLDLDAIPPELMKALGLKKTG